ncbi:MAG: methyltransferase domain-containing protein [Pedosphaera sp.]|nr:methyltransferase domain-containing protein [Pedosphaera sp.]
MRRNLRIEGPEPINNGVFYYMLTEQHRKLIGDKCGGGLVLDVGGWADPFLRADYVLDQFRYETRGICYHSLGKLPRSVTYPDPLPGERFRRETWIQHDICQGNWPFPDKMFDYVICSHTLEDIPNPFVVCEELQRVSKAGYIEAPARVVEQTRGQDGKTGADHHHWVVEVQGNRVLFTANSVPRARPGCVGSPMLHPQTPVH